MGYNVKRIQLNQWVFLHEFQNQLMKRLKGKSYL